MPDYNSHRHCINECEHPQPFIHPVTEKELCGKCWFINKIESVMIPCTPEFCGDD